MKIAQQPGSARLKQNITIINWILFGILLAILETTCFINVSDSVRITSIISCFLVSLGAVAAEIILSLKQKTYSFLVQYLIGTIMIIAIVHYLYSVLGWIDERNATWNAPFVTLGIYIIIKAVSNKLSNGAPKMATRRAYLLQAGVFLGLVLVVAGLVFTWTPNHEIYSREVKQGTEFYGKNSEDHVFFDKAKAMCEKGKLIEYRLYYCYQNQELNKEGIQFIFHTGDKRYTSLFFSGNDIAIQNGFLKSLAEEEVVMDENVEEIIHRAFLNEKRVFEIEGIDWEKEFGTHFRFNFISRGDGSKTPTISSIEIGQTKKEMKYKRLY